MGKEIFKNIGYIMECLLEIIYPEPYCCSYCGRILKGEGIYGLCSSCLSQISKFREESDPVNGIGIPFDDDEKVYFDEMLSTCSYQGIVREMVHKLKYNDRRILASTMALMINEELKKRKIDYDVLVPVPIHKNRLKMRGYNQSELIAGEISNLNGVPVLNCLMRIKDTESQVLLNGYMRWYNVKDAFSCGTNLKGLRVVIIDDVITTGATMNFCAKILKEWGAGKVTAASFAG